MTAPTQVLRISCDDLRALLDADTITLVDALPEPQYDAEHLPGAVNLPGELTADLAKRHAPDRTRTVVTYCSGPSCHVRVYDGGKADWADAGLPFEGTRATRKAA